MLAHGICAHMIVDFASVDSDYTENYAFWFSNGKAHTGFIISWIWVYTYVSRGGGYWWLATERPSCLAIYSLNLLEVHRACRLSTVQTDADLIRRGL